MHKTYSLASSVYGTGRGLAPTRLDGKVRAVEDRLLGLTTPVVEAVQGVGDRVLVNLDAGVRSWQQGGDVGHAVVRGMAVRPCPRQHGPPADAEAQSPEAS